MGALTVVWWEAGLLVLRPGVIRTPKLSVRGGGSNSSLTEGWFTGFEGRGGEVPFCATWCKCTIFQKLQVPIEVPWFFFLLYWLQLNNWLQIVSTKNNTLSPTFCCPSSEGAVFINDMIVGERYNKEGAVSGHIYLERHVALVQTNRLTLLC